jgi:hypothetical protein
LEDEQKYQYVELFHLRVSDQLSEQYPEKFSSLNGSETQKFKRKITLLLPFSGKKPPFC